MVGIQLDSFLCGFILYASRHIFYSTASAKHFTNLRQWRELNHKYVLMIKKQCSLHTLYMSILCFLALSMLAFTTRRMVRTTHLALSPIRFTAQFDQGISTPIDSWFDVAVSDKYSYEEIHTALLDTARWADLATRHHIKPSPKGSDLMWWLVLRWDHVALPTMPYAYILVCIISQNNIARVDFSEKKLNSWQSVHYVQCHWVMSFRVVCAPL